MGEKEGWKSLSSPPSPPPVKPAGKCSPAAAVAEQKRAGAAVGRVSLLRFSQPPPAGSLCRATFRGHRGKGGTTGQGREEAARELTPSKAPWLHCSWGLPNFGGKPGPHTRTAVGCSNWDKDVTCYPGRCVGA